MRDEPNVKNKIFNILNIAYENDVDIICFPEMSFSKNFIECVSSYKDVIVIGGSYYENNYNICPVFVNGQVYPVYKINPSPHLESKIAPGKGMNSGNEIKIFKTKDNKINFAVLICMDYLNESWRLYHQLDATEKIHLIFNPQFNPKPDRFQRQADVDCENQLVDIMQINAMRFGGTCAIGREHKDVIRRFKKEGFRSDDPQIYKICEVPRNEEVAIIIDLNIFKSVVVPTPIETTPTPRISIVGRYAYRDEKWENMDLA